MAGERRDGGPEGLTEPRPALSICVPTFNRPAQLRQALLSIVESGVAVASRVEILVSDNSPDVSEPACREVLATWPGRSLYLANRTNIGMVPNFNQCIERASGRYILFIHDDDRLLAGALPVIAAAITGRREPDPVLLFGAEVVDESGRIMRHQGFDRESRMSPEAALHRVLSDIEFVRFPAIVVARDAYLDVGPFDESVGQPTDLEMWVRLFARFGLTCLPGMTGSYSVHPGMATRQMELDGAAIDNLMEIFDRAKRTGVLSALAMARCQRLFFHQLILGTAYYNLGSGDVGRARRSMDLFDSPAVRTLGLSLPWLPIRVAFWVLVRCPQPAVRAFMSLLKRLDLVRRVRMRRLRSRQM